MARKIALRPELNLTAGNTYSLRIECKVSNNGVAMAGQSVSVRRNMATVYGSITDINGYLIYTLTGAQTNVEQNLSIRFCLDGLAEEAEIMVTIPAIATATSGDDDPEQMILYPIHDGAGSFQLFIRVLKHLGKGLATQVRIIYQGASIIVDTDAHGEAVLPLPGILAPGDSHDLTATVDGIAESADVKIRRPRDPQNVVPRFSRGWWLGTNNGRAFILMLLTLVMWIICISIGPGEPIINKGIFRDKESRLSTQEQLYNRVVGDIKEVSGKPVEDKLTIDPQPEPDSGHKIWWKLAFALTIFTVIYTALSMREEIAEGFREGVDRLMYKKRYKAGDPALDKLAKWIGTYRAVRHPAAAGTTPGGAPAEGEGKTVGKIIGFELLFEAIFHIVPAILRRVF